MSSENYLLKTSTDAHICSICNNLFILSKNLIFHLNEEHKTPITYQYLCKFNKCNKYFQNLYKFKCHVKKHDDTENSSEEMYTPKSKISKLDTDKIATVSVMKPPICSMTSHANENIDISNIKISIDKLANFMQKQT